MLTATLPIMLEFELEASMAAQMTRYIRMATTRVRTRYLVDVCSAGNRLEQTIELCRRTKAHLGRRKGVVYCRSRNQCEQLAQELECAYYHAGAVDNQERLTRWLETGGLIVATSALGTGVDVPGIVFVLHVDVPYGMIDFAQESGRAGRNGEDVDSVIVVEEGRLEMLAEMSRGNVGIDQRIIDEFVTTRECRRLVMSRYLDGLETTCASNAVTASCDRCGSGLTELKRRYAAEAKERQVTEETLSELTDGCAWCWGQRSYGITEGWKHNWQQCPQQRDAAYRDDGSFVQHETGSHSCFRSGISQALCRAGRDILERCRWPGIMDRFVAELIRSRPGLGVLDVISIEGGLDSGTVDGSRAR
ncbi:hypothetical protein LTR56_024514 [Elasticomyces elasticus]|nr:hypothetical protein LTR22_026709 [Elasticomyces elasticus]KAK3618628.1 hypothetical protein LTR56_024514 [Elasticomyces elasticus]KAK4901034.1 hypothetical protein LTR49_027356 [Elasticomyces elasticus]